MEEGSPAFKAGLQPGDILKKWNGKELGDAWAFIRSVQETAVGSRATVEVVRRDQALVLPVTIEARQAQPTPGALRPASVGIDTVALTPKLAASLRLPFGRGLLVSSIDLWRDDESALVRVGDIILAVDGQPALDPGTFSSYVQSRRPGTRISLKILRDGEEKSASFQLPNRDPRPQPAIRGRSAGTGLA